MRLAIPIIVALLLFAGLAQAADVPTMKGDKAFVFMFDGLANLDLDTYAGGIGMRYYFADYLAIRGGLHFDMVSETIEPCSEDPDGYPDEEFSSTDIGIQLVLEKHLDPCSSVSPYIGVGGGFHTYSEEMKDPTEYYDDDTSEYTFGTDVCTYDQTLLTIFGVAGFEWAFTDCMTLGGEYQLGFESASGTHETDYADPNWDTETCDASGTWMGFGEASVFLSVYW